MEKYTKLTLDEMIRRKEQVMAAKKKPAKRELYIESLDGVITIAEQPRSVFADIQEMSASEADAYAILQGVVEPDLKKLASEYGCAEPTEIVDIIFKAGEVGKISVAIAEISGANSNTVTTVKDIKN